jgi:hypothetical protein
VYYLPVCDHMASHDSLVCLVVEVPFSSLAGWGLLLIVKRGVTFSGGFRISEDKAGFLFQIKLREGGSGLSRIPRVVTESGLCRVRNCISM